MPQPLLPRWMDTKAEDLAKVARVILETGELPADWKPSQGSGGGIGRACAGCQ